MFYPPTHHYLTGTFVVDTISHTDAVPVRSFLTIHLLLLVTLGVIYTFPFDIFDSFTFHVTVEFHVHLRLLVHSLRYRDFRSHVPHSVLPFVVVDLPFPGPHHVTLPTTLLMTFDVRSHGTFGPVTCSPSPHSRLIRCGVTCYLRFPTRPGDGMNLGVDRSYGWVLRLRLLPHVVT